MNVASIKNVAARRVALSAWFVGAAVVMAVIFPHGIGHGCNQRLADAVREASSMVAKHWRNYVSMCRDAASLWRA